MSRQAVPLDGRWPTVATQYAGNCSWCDEDERRR